MKAMIFAAGLGTRLRPYTNNKPKAMVEVGGMPLLEIAIRRLKFFGVNEIMINVHHFAPLIIDFIKAKKQFDIHIVISDERDLLLETGGGLKKAQWFFDNEPFFVYNTDILNNIDLLALYEKQKASTAIATLAVSARTTSRYLIFNEAQQLVGWRNVKTGEEKWSKASNTNMDWAFSGIQVIDPRFFTFMPEKEVFSTIEVYLEVAKTEIIQAVPHAEPTIWLDVGKPEALMQAADLLDQIPLA